MRVAARNARMVGLRQARLHDQLLDAGCSRTGVRVTHCWRNAALPMEAPTHGGTVLAMQAPTIGRSQCFSRWPVGHQGRYRCMSVKRMQLLKAAIKVHGRALRPCSIFGAAMGSVLQVEQMAVRPPRPLLCLCLHMQS